MIWWQVSRLTLDVCALLKKIELNPSESKTVKLSISADDLAFVNELGKWTLEEGDFRLQVGNQVDVVKCKETKIWKTPNK